MKKFTLIFCLLTLGVINQFSFSQNENLSNDFLKDSPFIFKGTVISNTPFKGSNGKWFIAYNININTIYKGNEIITGSILLVTESVTGWSETEYGHIPNIVSEYTNEEKNKFSFMFGVGSTRLFFCKEYNSKSEVIPNIMTDNSVIIEPVSNNRDCFFEYYPKEEIINKQVNKSILIKGLNKEFNTEKELFDFLKKVNILVQTDIKKKDVKEIDKSYINSKKPNDIPYSQRLDNYNKYINNLQVKLNTVSQDKNNTCSEFFISEYIDGPNKNKVLEIFNPSESIKSLNGYSIKIFQNGAPTPLEIPLQGNVNPKETYVIAHPNASPDILAKANQTSNKMNFDGNDAIVLNQGISNYIDKIGEIGVNPGNSGWFVPPTGSTYSHGLRRKFPINKGDTDWAQSKNQWNIYPPDSLSNVKAHQNVCSSLLTNDITLSFANPIESGTNPRYFEFDVMISANNNNTYFENCLLRIAYNTNAFGSNVVANNKVTITKGGTYNSLTYIDPDANAIDQTGSVMGVPFGTEFGLSSWYRTLVTTTPTQLLHFKIEIQNCGHYTGIDYADITFTPIFSLYTLNANDNIVDAIGYDNTFYGTGLNELLCPPPVITNFFPNPITSGTKTVLTIQGYNFGTQRDSGQVWLNSDNGGSSQIKHFDHIDYVSWSDTEIKFIVPSKVDTLPNLYFERGVGTGLITVKRSDGAIDMSTTPLVVSYANMNISIGVGSTSYQKIPLRVISDYLDTCKYFYLDTSIVNNPQMEVAVTEALHHWSCATLINWYIKDSIIQQNDVDDISVIYLDDSYHGSPIGRTILSSGSVCTDIFGNKIGYYKDIDIGLSRDFNSTPATGWFIDTSYTQNVPTGLHDFYAVTQHELGHAHMLNHVNDNTDLMFYTTPYGPVNYVYRRDLYSSPNTIYGGIYVLDQSAYLNSCDNITIMLPGTAENCESNIGIGELFNSDIHLITYPNPFDEKLYISFSLKRNNDIELMLYDFIGRPIYISYFPKKGIGEHNLSLDLSNVESGIYFLIVDLGNRKETVKLIKL